MRVMCLEPGLDPILYRLYMRRPRLARYIPKDVMSRLATLPDNALPLLPPVPKGSAPAAKGKAQASVAMMRLDIEEGHESRAAVALHALLTMLAAPEPGKEAQERMTDLERALRRAAVAHPLLLLHHLPLLAAALKGTHQLSLHALRASNQLQMCGVILGVLELLQPTLFLQSQQQHQQANVTRNVVPTLDTLMALLREHGHLHRMGNYVSRLAQLLADWVACGGGQAHAYIRTHAHTLHTLHQHHPHLANVRALAAMSSLGLQQQQQQQQASSATREDRADASAGGSSSSSSSSGEHEAARRVLSASTASSLACVRGSVGGEGGGALATLLLPSWLVAQVGELQARLQGPLAPEERLELLKKVGEFPERWHAQVLPLFSQWMYEGVMVGGGGLLAPPTIITPSSSSGSGCVGGFGGREIRVASWELLVRLVHACPWVGARAARCVEVAVGSPDVAVRDAAVEQLPDLVLLLHDHAPDLLAAAFQACIASSSAASASVAAISESLTLLHLNTGS